jgi:hypothetical protein
MASITPVAYKPVGTIPGTEKYGNLIIGTTNQDYGVVGSNNGVKFWSTPDEDLGYIIAEQVPSGTQPNPLAIPAYVGFYSTSDNLTWNKTEAAFVDLTNYLTNNQYNFTNGEDAKNWLLANGYWTNYGYGQRLILDWNIQNNASYPGSGVYVFDLQGNSNGIFNGAIGYNSSSPKYLTITGTTSVYLKSLSDLNPTLNPPTIGEDISIFTWFYPTKSSGVILSEQGTPSPDTSWYDSQIELISGTLKVRVWPMSSPYLTLGAISINNWYHVGFTYNQATQTLNGFLNGVLINTVSVNRDSPGNNGAGLYYNFGYPTGTNMGSNTGNNFRLGQFQVYNYPLTSANVTSLFNTSKSIYGL